MFNVGGMELLVIGLVALIALGPDKLPGAIRQVGQVVGELRRISSGFQTDLRGALTEAEREAEQAAGKRANAAGPLASTPDPGAARAAAHAELAAAESALDDASSKSSVTDVGSEGPAEASSSENDDDPSHAAS